MTNVNKPNRFFKENIYPNLAGFAFSPVSWAFKEESSGYIAMPNFGKLLLAALLAPILVPATIVTSAIALCLAGIYALFHVLSLAVAGIADACSTPENQGIISEV
jgi:hypothetical protein